MKLQFVLTASKLQSMRLVKRFYNSQVEVDSIHLTVPTLAISSPSSELEEYEASCCPLDHLLPRLD